jgi:enamine deaminase RidA (YjgF/YER057c/UK114 family)
VCCRAPTEQRLGKVGNNRTSSDTAKETIMPVEFVDPDAKNTAAETSRASLGAMPRRTFVTAAAAALAAPAIVHASQAEEIQMSTSSGVAQHINPSGMHQSPVFSQAILLPPNARMLIIGGQNGVDEKGDVVASDLAGQTAKAVDYLVKVLEAAGGTLNDLVRVGLYIKGDGDIAPGFAEWMKRAGEMEMPPTVSAVRVLGLANPDFLIEIEATAVLSGS